MLKVIFLVEGELSFAFFCPFGYIPHPLDAPNPFGHSSTNLGSLYKGIVKDTFVSFKHLRKSKHTHHALDDALGNAEALLQLKEKFELKISLK
jgi:hypothetical protein